MTSQRKRCKFDAWQNAYNSTRSHAALAFRGPNKFAQQWRTAPSSTR